MQLDLTLSQDSHAQHTPDRAADELALEILSRVDSGMRFDRVDRALGLAPGMALKVWFEIAEACGDCITAH